MWKFALVSLFLGALCCAPLSVAADDAATCFESRKGASELTQGLLRDGTPNVKCSPKTGAVLWWGDPFQGTVAMGKMPAEDADYLHGKALVKPRSDKLAMLPLCGTTCHNGVYPAAPKSKAARRLAMHQNIVLDATKLPHGRGAVWCLDCHHPTQRNKLTDNQGAPVSFDQPQLLCGKCHGDVYRDWREGIHGKRIGEWASNGTKRWFVCTECHNPHNVQHAERNAGFAALEPERAPALPKGLKNADHEKRGAGH